MLYKLFVTDSLHESKVRVRNIELQPKCDPCGGSCNFNLLVIY